MDEKFINLPTTEELETLIAHRQFDKLKQILSTIHPADIANLLEDLETEDAVILFGLLPIEEASEVLDETGSIIRQELVEKVDDEKLADLLDELPMDDAAEFLYDLPDPISDRLIGLMEPEEAEGVRELLSYEDETAGRLMTRDVAALRRHWTVTETLEYLRSIEDAETLHYLYVVDRNDRLIGVVPLRTLIRSQADATIDSIMAKDIVAVPVTADQEELAELVSRYDYYAIPVVDDDNHFLGVVTVDDVLDIFEEEVTEDIQRLGGSEPLEQPYFAVTIPQMVGKRIGWLMLLFIAATLTGTVSRWYESLLDQVVTLSFFIPLVIGTGGNAGSQTVATIIRSITLDEVKLSTLGAALRQEVTTGFLLGLAMALLGIVRAILWKTGFGIALVVGITLPLVVIWATTVATVVPILADRFRIDPTVISGPMISTIVDTTGLLIYFSLATYFLGNF